MNVHRVSGASGGRRWWVRVIAAAAFVAVLGGLAAAESDAQDKSRADLEARFVLRGSAAAAFIQTYTSSVLDHEQALARKRLSDRTITDAQFQDIVDAFGFGPTAVFDAAGRVLDIAPYNPDLVGTDIASRYAHLRRAESGHAAVSDVVPSAAQAIPVVAFATPFQTAYGRRVISGTFAASTQPMGLYLDHVLPWTDSAAYLVDENGMIVAASTRLGGTLVQTDSALAIAIGHGATGGFQAGNGSRFRFTTTAVAGTPWRVVLAAPVANVLSPISTGSRLLPWLFLLALALTGGALVVMFVRNREAGVVATRDARTDPLTGIANRRAIEESFLRLVGDRRSYKPGLGILMIDIDHFKLVNDSFGHDGGDIVLVEVIARIVSCLRTDDQIGRWGGEEFVVLLPNADPIGIAIVAERIRARVAQAPIVVKRASAALTVSIGGVMGTPHDDLESVVMHADMALYSAKQSGRDRCVVS